MHDPFPIVILSFMNIDQGNRKLLKYKSGLTNWESTNKKKYSTILI